MGDYQGYYAMLGDIKFQNLLGFNSFSRQGSATYAEHKTLVGKPLLQPTGNTLDEISVSMRFHVSFCTPIDQLNALKQYRDTYEVLPLKLGNGRNEGDFVITDISDVVEDADFQGNVFSYTVSCTLKEYVTLDKLQAQQDAARKAAAAVGDKKAVAKKRTNPLTCKQTVAKLVTTIDNNAHAIDKVISGNSGKLGFTTQYPVMKSINTITAKTSTLLTMCNTSGNCANGNQGLHDTTVLVSSANNSLSNAISLSDPLTIFSPDPTNILERNKNLQACVVELKSAASKLTNQSITGQ